MPRGEHANDQDSCELADGQGLKWLIQSNVERAGAFIGHIHAAKQNLKQSLENLEEKYEKLAD